MIYPRAGQVVHPATGLLLILQMRMKHPKHLKQNVRGLPANLHSSILLP